MVQELDGAQLIRQLMSLEVEHPDRILEIVREFGIKSVMTKRGLMDVKLGASTGQYTICSPKTVAGTAGKGYTGVAKKTTGQRSATPTARSKAMAKATAEVETEEVGEKDYSVYADKPATPAMEDFAKWLVDEVGLEFPSKAAEASFRDGVRLGGTLRMEFQKSDFNREQRAARQAARAADNGAEEEAAPAPKATRGKAATPKATTAKATPAKRGRPKATATAGAEAPF